MTSQPALARARAIPDHSTMTTWSDFAAAAPEIAAAGYRLIYRTEIGEALLATVRGDEPPRVHPIYVAVLDGRLFAFLGRSTKCADLEADGRYALHSHQDPAAPSEFLVRGRARVVTDPVVRAGAAARWSFEPDETYTLFEFAVEHAVLGERPDAETWPPRYSSWRAEAATAQTTA
jgi:hypothetical protein